MKWILSVFICLSLGSLHAQKMNNAKLDKIIKANSSTLDSCKKIAGRR